MLVGREGEGEGGGWRGAGIAQKCLKRKKENYLWAEFKAKLK